MIVIKVYKRNLMKLLTTIIVYSIAVFVSVIIVLYYFESTKIATGLALLEILLALYSLYSDSQSKITVDYDVVTFQLGSKKHVYQLSKTDFGATTSDNGVYEIIAYTNVDGEIKQSILDCSFLSYHNFQCLLEDLGVTGAKQKVIKVETTKK